MVFFVVLIAIVPFVYKSIKFNDYVANEYLTEMKTLINQKASVVSIGKIEINASIFKVWSVLTSINNWPDWQNDVTEAQINGEVMEGATYKWKTGGLKFRSQIHTMDFLKQFGWTGKQSEQVPFITGLFRKGRTNVHCSRRKFARCFSYAFKYYFQKNLGSGILKNLIE